MKRSRFGEEQIRHCMKQAEVGVPAKDPCRKCGITEQTFYRWKKAQRGLSVILQDALRKEDCSLDASGRW